jgi:hypothetical protein
LNTLNYAARTMNIKNTPILQVNCLCWPPDGWKGSSYYQYTERDWNAENGESISLITTGKDRKWTPNGNPRFLTIKQTQSSSSLEKKPEFQPERIIRNWNPH